MLIALSVIVLALGLGSGLTWARLCLVSAAEDWVLRRDPGGLRFQAQLVAALTGMFLLQLAFQPATALVPTTGGTVGLAMIGGTVLAAGAILNGGCYLGSMGQIGIGRLRFLFTLMGMYLAQVASFPMRFMLGSSELILPVMAAPVVSLLVVGGAILAWLYLPRRLAADQVERHCGVVIAALCATGLFLALPGVSYGAAIAVLAHPDAGGSSLRPLAGAAILLGAIAASMLSGRWQLEPPNLSGAMRCLAGGYIMATGAQCIPGGSDSWLLWSMPRGGLNGLAAYLSAGAAILLWCRISLHLVRAGLCAPLRDRRI